MSLYEQDSIATNLLFLQGCRDLARQDKVLAAHKYGVSAHFVDRIARASGDDLKELAKSQALIFVPRSMVALEVLLGAILAPGITGVQVEAVRAASLLSDTRVKVA